MLWREGLPGILFWWLPALSRDVQECETVLCWPCTSTMTLWACCPKEHRLGQIECQTLASVPCIEAVPLPFPDLSWVGFLGVSLQRRLRQKFHYQTPISLQGAWSFTLWWSIHPPLTWRRHNSSRSSNPHLGSAPLYKWNGLTER